MESFSLDANPNLHIQVWGWQWGFEGPLDVYLSLLYKFDTFTFYGFKKEAVIKFRGDVLSYSKNLTKIGLRHDINAGSRKRNRLNVHIISPWRKTIVKS